jgi:hypothetical protein
MAYQRKTKDVWHIEVNYGGGWEHELTEDSWLEAKAQLKCYRENCPQYPVRARRRRERIYVVEPQVVGKHNTLSYPK